MPKLTLNRRTLLRGIAGGSLLSLALPPFEATLNNNGTAFADGEELPVRFMTFFWADGINIGRFEPAMTGATWSLGEEMAPLEPVKDYINLCTGLQNRSSVAKTHHEGMTVFNGYDYLDGGGLDSDAGGPTIDQRIADIVSVNTPVHSMHVQVSKRVSTDNDGGTTAIALSHRGTPGDLITQVPLTNPKTVWQSLFGEFTAPVDRRAPRTRVLDAIHEDAKRLRTRLGSTDKKRLDAHLVAVDELEKKINAVVPACALPGEPTEQNVDTGGVEPLSEVNSLMAELIAMAFVCDVTRVASFIFKRFVSGTVFDEINAGDIHHSASHAEGSETYHDGVMYQMQKLSDVLQVLESKTEADDTNLLDSTIVYASTDCSTGFTHSIARQPIIVAGHGRGHLLHPGIHYQQTTFNGNEGGPNADGNTSDVLLTCLKAFDPDATSVGAGAPESTTPLSDIIA